MPPTKLKLMRPRVLDAGSGPRNMRPLHGIFAKWQVVRLDINPTAQPDLVGSITDLQKLIPDRSFDAIWSSHNLEHLYRHELAVAFGEMRRILLPHGFALVTVPDLQQVARALASDDLDAQLYLSKAGPISAHDILFGHQASIARGNLFMAHKTGFTPSSLGKCLIDGGFAQAWVAAGPNFDLWAVALMPSTDTTALKQLLKSTPQSYLADAAP